MKNFDQINNISIRLKAMLLTLPAKIGTECVNFFKQSFRNQGWTDTVFSPWAKRSPKAKRNAGRGILMDSGVLRNSIRISEISQNSVTIGTDVPYAEIHNEGFDGMVTVKAHSRTSKSQNFNSKLFKSMKKIAMVKEHPKQMRMPKRKFMGVSVALTNNIKELIRNNIIKTLN